MNINMKRTDGVTKSRYYRNAFTPLAIVNQNYAWQKLPQNKLCQLA